MKRLTCDGCAHWRSTSGSSTGVLRACMYLLDTGRRRGCPADACDKYTKKRKEVHANEYEDCEFAMCGSIFD